jgi:hypothetical protein
MPLPSTMTPIATNTLSTATASVTFSSIPQGYTDLVLVTNVKSISGTKDLVVRVNGDTGTNYSWTALMGDGTTVYNEKTTNYTNWYLEYAAYVGSTLNANTITSFMNYSNTTTFKSYLTRGNNASYGTSAVTGLWRSTSAISSIVVYFDQGGNMDVGSTFTLYGIKAA